MKVYLAAPYAAREQVLRYADELTNIGYTVTARWLQGTHESDAEATASREQRAQWASEDLQDVRAAEVLVAFTQAAVGLDGCRGHSGGRHVELGHFVADKGTRQVILVGEPENVFHDLIPTTPETWHDALVILARWLVDATKDSRRARPRIVNSDDAEAVMSG